MPWSAEPLVTDSLFRTPSPGRPERLPFYRGILELPLDVLLSSWSGEPHLYDPRAGLVTGSEFADYLARTREWLALGDASLRPVSAFSAAGRSVEEVIVELTVGGERQELPVAVVAEQDAEQLLTSVRIYHSLWPLFANHRAATPVVDPGPAVPLPAVVRRNQQARAAEDLASLLDTYEDDAAVQTSSGGLRSFHGREEIRRLFAMPSIPGVKPVVQLCSATDDGHSCAVEYRVVTPLSEPDPDQVGVTVYVLGETGRIATERAYVMGCSSTQPAPNADPAGRDGGGRLARFALVPRDTPALGGDA
jgi:hypothetical protein